MVRVFEFAFTLAAMIVLIAMLLLALDAING